MKRQSHTEMTRAPGVTLHSSSGPCRRAPTPHCTCWLPPTKPNMNGRMTGPAVGPRNVQVSLTSLLLCGLTFDLLSLPLPGHKLVWVGGATVGWVWRANLKSAGPAWCAVQMGNGEAGLLETGTGRQGCKLQAADWSMRRHQPPQATGSSSRFTRSWG